MEFRNHHSRETEFKISAEYCEGPLFNSLEEVDEYQEGLAEAEMSFHEQQAEGAWLRHAEAPTNDDLGFEQWEASRGLR